MASRSSSSTCCLTLPLRLEKWQADRLAKRFEIARQIYNTLLRAELKKLRQLERAQEYRQNQALLAQLYTENAKDSKMHKEAAKKRSALLRSVGMSEYGFKSDIKDYYKYFSDNIGSHVAVHCIASQVWIAFEKYLYGTGKQIHFKKQGELNSLKGYSAKKSGGTEIIYRGDHIEWKGLRLPVKHDPRNSYESEMLTRHIKYVRLVRAQGKNRDRWYAQLSLEGEPVVKIDPATGLPQHPVGEGAVGIDIGPQTVAYASSDEVALLELADRVQNIEHQKRIIQRKLDRSRRASNPGNYAEDGTIRRGIRLTHFKSKRYLRLQRELAFLQSHQAKLRKLQHTELANHLLSLGDCFYVEDMEWPALLHRAKETAISEKTGRYKRKKRFGKSIANKAPGMLIQILQQKCNSLGLPGVVKVPTSVRASQYNHITKDYQKKPLGQRWNYLPDGKQIQRDLYSAFLLQHTNALHNGFVQDALEKDYDKFVTLHDGVISSLIHSQRTISSMGILRISS